jgi:Uma2 family endonuclease
MSAIVRERCTAEEYLALERAAEHRSELIEGRIRQMPRNNRRHNLIAGSLLVAMIHALRGGTGEVYGFNMRVKVSRTGLYAYPDVVALRGTALVEDAHEDTLLNPAAIVEVLSDATEVYDRGEKFAHYRKLDSLGEYTLVSQDRPCIEQYVRSAEGWVLREVSGLDTSLSVQTLGCTIALTDIYDRVQFPSPGTVEGARWSVAVDGGPR